jgi:hypothetical protein
MTPPGVWSGAGAASNSPACPSVGFFYGMINELDKSMDNITAFVCSQSFQEIDTTTTFIASEMTISTENPPVINESSVRWVANTSGSAMFVDQVQNWAPWSRLADTSLQTGTPQNIDSFFQTLMLGTEGIPFEELLGEANEQRLVAAVEHLYRKYMAQAISANMRALLPLSVAAPSYNAMLPASNTQARLVQHDTSKLILQILLGIMLFCNLIILPYTRRFRRLLPYCPWSLFGVMALFIGSELCDEHKVLPVGAESMSNEELEEVLRGWVFSLGWWGVGEEKRYGIDVGRARAEADADEKQQTDDGDQAQEKKAPPSTVRAVNVDNIPHPREEITPSPDHPQSESSDDDNPMFSFTSPRTAKIRQNTVSTRFPSLHRPDH